MPPVRGVFDPPELPPAGFDPIGNLAHRASLERYWLPSCPDEGAAPELFEHWREMFSEPLCFKGAESRRADSPIGRLPTPRDLRVSRLFQLRSSALRATAVTFPVTSSSRNWSGAYLLPNRGERFTRIVGRWRIPHVRSGAEFGPADLPFRCSVWIGLDGKKRWSESMPQVGTEHTVGREGVPEEPRLWWQWWLRDGPSSPFYIDGVRVRADDTVLCSLTAVSPNLVRFHVKNCDTGEFAGVAVTEPVALRGSSAEWIVEQPSRPELVDGVLEAGPLFPLPDFDPVIFRRCAASAAVGHGQPDRYRPLDAPRLVRMVRTLRRPSRSALISRPERRGQAEGALQILPR